MNKTKKNEICLQDRGNRSADRRSLLGEEDEISKARRSRTRKSMEREVRLIITKD